MLVSMLGRDLDQGPWCLADGPAVEILDGAGRQGFADHARRLNSATDIVHYKVT